MRWDPLKLVWATSAVVAITALLVQGIASGFVIRFEMSAWLRVWEVADKVFLWATIVQLGSWVLVGASWWDKRGEAS